MQNTGDVGSLKSSSEMYQVYMKYTPRYSRCTKCNARETLHCFRSD